MEILGNDIFAYLWNKITKFFATKEEMNAKANSATTLSGYGITDANIAEGIITLGSNTITPLTSHQDISGKANASEMAVSTSGDQTTITLKNGTSATVINSHQDISGKVNSSDLATVATTGNYTDLIGAPQYVMCTLSAYNAMNTHDSNTYYIIIEDNNA